MTIEEAIERLKANYELALRLKFVRRPVAWALYRTWEEADKRRR